MACCDTCACRDEPFECLSVVDPIRFGRFAEWCRGDDANSRRHVLGRSRIAADRGHEVAAVAQAAVTQTATPRPDVAEALRINGLMRSCPWRGPASCGCGGLATCAVGLGRNGLVNYQDCAACLKAEA